MFWARSQLFWKIVGLYVLLSLLALAGLMVTLNAQLKQQAEDLHREDALSLTAQFHEDITAAEQIEPVYRRWRESLLIRGFRLWLVDDQNQSVLEETAAVPDRAVIQSAIRTALRTGESVRWMRDDPDDRQVLIVAQRCSLLTTQQTETKPAVILLLSDTESQSRDHKLFASAANRTAIFTWLIGVVCVAFVALGLVGPLQIMTANLNTSVERVQRQDMLLRISDRHDELGNVAQSLTQLEEDREDRILALQLASRNAESTVDLLSAVLDSMVEGVIAIDDAERIVFLNGAARRLLGISDFIGVGHRLYEAVRIPSMLDTIAESLTTKKMQALEFRTTREGLSLAMVVNPIHKGPHQGAVAVVRDISELRKLESMRRDFVSGVSHELKTPLTVIQACTDTLLDGAVDDPEVSRRFLKQIDEQSERLLQLILGMLQLARVESGAEVFQLEPVSLSEVVTDVVAALEPVAEGQQISLQCEGRTDLIAIADYHALRTVISNLLDNAIKHTPAGGTVILTLEDDAGSPVLSVTDTGVGIAAEHLSRIFERFYRVDRDRSRERGGTGLGLAIVKHLCHTMKAAVSVRSEPGRGTEFRIVFRSEQDAAIRPKKSVSAMP